MKTLEKKNTNEGAGGRNEKGKVNKGKIASRMDLKYSNHFFLGYNYFGYRITQYTPLTTLLLVVVVSAFIGQEDAQNSGYIYLSVLRLRNQTQGTL